MRCSGNERFLRYYPRSQTIMTSLPNPLPPDHDQTKATDAHVEESQLEVCQSRDTHAELKESQLEVCQSRLQEYEETIWQYQRMMRLMETRILELEKTSHQSCSRKEVDSKQLLTQKQPHFTKPLDEATKHPKANVSQDTTIPTTASSSEDSFVAKVETCSGPPTPCNLYKGSAVAHLGKAYFTPSGSNEVYSFDTATSVWVLLPECPQSYFALVIVNGLLTAVGGENSRHLPINTLSSLMVDSDARDTSSAGQWCQHFPTMPTRRIFPTAVTHDIHLIVAGGGTTWVQGSSNLTTVEFLNTCGLQWFTASSLPRPVRGASAAVCGDSLFLLGGWDDTGSAVFTCVLDHLISSGIEVCRHTNIDHVTVTTKTYPHCLWSTVADAPTCQSTCVSLNGQLVTIGGRGSQGLPVSSVHEYQQDTNSWTVIGHLETPCYHCLAVEVVNGRLMVMGGLMKGGYGTNKVEIITYRK